MKKQNNKVVSAIGTIVGIAVIGAVICGVLECLGANTRAIGGVFAIVPVLFLAVFVVGQIVKCLLK